MPLTFQQIMQANLKPLKEAAEKWKQLPNEFKGIGADFKSTVVDGLPESKWTGQTATAARKKFRAASKEVVGAAEEAGGVAALLLSAHYKISSVQKKLKAYSSDIAESKHLSMSNTGEVIFDSPEQDHDVRLRLRGQHNETISDYNRKIRALVREASEADESLAWALSQDRNGRARGFNDQPYYSLSEASKERTKAAADAKKAQNIIISGMPSDHKEQTWLARVLAKREGDPYFAEKVAAGAGPQKILDFWAGVNDRGMHNRENVLTRLQKSLGNTMATASRSDSTSMKKWKEQMIDVGNQRAGDPFLMPSRTSRPYGFQVMSALLRNGQYDTEFLREYTRAALKFETEGKGVRVWATGGVGTDPHRLSFEGDGGTDPMSGIMEGLGNNPEAAKQVFSSQTNLEYLMKERDWPEYFTADYRDKPAYQELGRALNAATLGVPTGESGLNRSPESARIAEQVIEIVTSEEEYLKEREGLEGGLARIGAGYIDDITRASSDEGGDSNLVFNKDPEKNEKKVQELFGDRGEYSADLNYKMSSKFLGMLGENESAHEAMMAAQHAYTAARLEESATNTNEAQVIQKSGAHNHGILDAARVREVHSAYEDSVEDAQHSLAKSSNWAKYGLSAGVGVAAGVGAALTGTGVVAAVAVPLLMEAAGGAYDTVLDNSREDKLKEADFGDSATTKEAIRDYLIHGMNRVEDPAHKWSGRDTVSGSDQMDLNADAKAAYMRALTLNDAPVMPK